MYKKNPTRKYALWRRYRNVLRLRAEGMSFDDIAKRYGLSRQRIYQIHKNALAWLPDSPAERIARNARAEDKERRAKIRAEGVRKDRTPRFGKFRDLQPTKRWKYQRMKNVEPIGEPKPKRKYVWKVPRPPKPVVETTEEPRQKRKYVWRVSPPLLPLLPRPGAALESPAKDEGGPKDESPA